MIIRVFRARVRQGQLDAWQQKVEEHSIPWMREQEGMVAFYPGKPVDEKSREFTMISVWRDADSIRKSVGENWTSPVLLADEADLVEDVEMHHYEIFGQ